ncbi:O-antigen translocase [Aquincola sp. MAHUQ-54]|uniref:O-antigen translocase n=1 Tax=Aquincola agrisoli TaxID=3119538 RepID=A0AAW9QMQ5_9BURK
MRPDAASPGRAEGTSYGQILRSSALMGGSSLVALVASVLRTKAIAMLLGPAGVGLASLFGAVGDLARSLSQMGIGSSGVRHMAEAAGSGDTAQAARTAAVLRRVSGLLGLAGGAALVLFSRPISVLTFDHAGHAAEVAWLGAAVFFGVVADGQAAVLQGMRHIRALAGVAVATAVGGTVLGVASVAAWGEAGIVPSLVATAFVTCAAAAWQARRLGLPAQRVEMQALWPAAGALLKLGIAFMASGLLVTGAGYAVRTLVLRLSGLEAAGLYQGAWMVGGVYVGFILQAMSSDFYPRLVAAANDDARTNRLVNEQAQVSLLLAGPGVLATLTLAPLALTLLYSHRFDGAAEVLRWLCLGMAMRVVTWPMGFIIVARGHRLLFLSADFIWALAHVAAAWLGLHHFGLAGAGMAFFASYVLHAAVVYPIVRRLSGFRWSPGNLRTGGAMLGMAGACFVGFVLLPTAWAAAFGAALTAASTVLALHRLLALAPVAVLPSPVRRLLALFTAPGRVAAEEPRA